MSQENKARHVSNCQIAIESAVIADGKQHSKRAYAKTKRRRKTDSLLKQDIIKDLLLQHPEHKPKLKSFIFGYPSVLLRKGLNFELYRS